MPAPAATTSPPVPPSAPANGGSGIARLLDDPPPALAEYVALVRELGLYPGSPLLARRLLRPQDRLVCCELHPEDYADAARQLRPRPAGGGASARCVGGAGRAAAAARSGAAWC